MKKIFIVLFCFSTFLYAENFDSLIKNMSYEEKAAQVLMVSVGGNTVFPAYSFTHFKGINPGAVILFKFNIANTPETVRNFTDSCIEGFAGIANDSNIQSIPPFIAVDNEGGRVYRTKEVTSKLPAPLHVAENLSSEKAERLYNLTAGQMKQMGLSLNLAPIAEKAQKNKINVMGDRIFSDNLHITQKYSIAFIRGMKEGGITSVVKHFPGNGSDDLHSGSSKINTDYDAFLENYIAPFKNVLPTTEVIMISHVIVPCIDSQPFCFSKKGIDFLRNDLNFSGLILTDDLVMKALQKKGKTIIDLAITALDAGCNMLMYSGRDVKMLVSGIAEKAKTDSSFAEKLNKSVEKILTAKLNANLIDADGNYIEQPPFNKLEFMKYKNEANDLVETKF